jgi:hypothetical protein
MPVLGTRARAGDKLGDYPEILWIIQEFTIGYNTN